MKNARQQALTDIIAGAALLLSPLPAYIFYRVGLRWLQASQRAYALTHPPTVDDRWLLEHERLAGFTILLGIVGFVSGLVVFGMGLTAYLRTRRGEI